MIQPLKCVKIPFYSEQPGSTEPDVHHIDFRVGKILSAKRHPDADTLFVEESKQQIIYCCQLSTFCKIFLKKCVLLHYSKKLVFPPK